MESDQLSPLHFEYSAMTLWKISVILCFVCALSEPQFRSDLNKDIYDQPYNRPTTSRPNQYAIPAYRNPSYRHPSDNVDDPLRNQQYHYSDSVRYRGNEYRTNIRGGPEYGTRERDRLRLNYNQYNQDNPELEFRNTIFDRWRPDLQGEKRPGETPGINLPLAEDVFVSTDTGKLQGFYVYLYDFPGARPEERPANKPLELQRHYLNVTVFLGVPYAQPPYNEGRFKPPRRVHNWHTTWQAIDYSPACPQNLKYIGASMGIRSGIDEDCLYLNIFTPSLSVNARERYPVMFYVHGGDFDHGAGSQFPAHMLSAWGEVVVVTLNYRLGALGFLSTGDYHSPGNYGLMDMALALEWVYNNIRFFNGDRDRISVCGPGAGGAASGLLAVLPKTRDWVHQVIAESGSPLAEWAAIDDPYRVQNTSRVFGLEMGCNVENSYNLLHCLVNRDYEELATAPITPDVGTFAWSPVVDGNFTVPGDSWYEEWNEQDWHILPELPIELYRRNEHHRYLRYLTGVNRDEAANFVYNDIRLSQNNFVVTEDFFNERIRDWVKHYNYTLNPQGAYDAIKWKYTFWPDPHNTTHIREQYIHMLSDALYKSGVDQVVKVLINSTSKSSVPTYYYVLNTTVEAIKMPLWREVPNGLEYYFISGAPFMDPEFYPDRYRVSRQLWTEGDRNISQFMMKTFANFAKWGNPTLEQVEPIRVNWEPTVEGALKYLSINNTFNTTMDYNYRQDGCTFWYQYMPLVVREYVPTPIPPRNPWIDMKEPVTATMYALLAVVVAFFVVLCVCCGLWKSAKRQRNKALDDLSYYSTENLSLTKEEDYEVRNYLEKLNGLRQQNGPSRSGTLNTILSGEHTTQSSLATTPNVGTSADGNVTSQGGNLTEPDNYSSFKTKRQIPMKQQQKFHSQQQIQQNLSQNLPARDTVSLQEKPMIMELEEPSRVIKGHGGPASHAIKKSQDETVNYSEPLSNHNYNIHESHGYADHQLGIPELPPYTEPLTGTIEISPVPSTSSPTENHKIEYFEPPYQDYSQPHIPTSSYQHQLSNYGIQTHVSQPQPHVPYEPQRYVSQPQVSYEQQPLVTQSQVFYKQLPQATQPQLLYEAQPDLKYELQPGTTYEIHHEMHNGDGHRDETVHRPATPANSAVTFEISMKPSRSVGTISNSSGLILNTDL